MVAMAISLLLLGGVVSIFVSSKSSYETNERIRRAFRKTAALRSTRS